MQELNRQDKLIDSLIKVLPNGKKGNVQVDEFTVDEAEVKRVRMQAIMGGYGYGYEFAGFEAGTYKRLLINGKTMMSTTDMERQSNRDIMYKANGHVFIAGLGLGMILLPIQEKKDVKSVTVVENNINVIQLVGKKLPLNKKVKIIHCDVFNYTPDKVFDTVYFDIWNKISSENWEQMKELTKKFKNKVNRANERCVITSWRKEDVQRMASEERRADRDRMSFENMFGSNKMA